jgi:hypothetical protein
MKIAFLSLCLTAIVCMTVVNTGCIYDAQSGQIVVKEKICVNMTQYEEDGSISVRAVDERFRERLLNKVEDYGATLDDIDDISVVSATCKLVNLKGHDWTITADVYVKRLDVSDGPEMLAMFDNASLKSFGGAPTEADFDSDGVDLINRALDDLLAGGDPQLALELTGESIVPVPSPSDPLEFRWLACVEFQAVVNLD